MMCRPQMFSLLGKGNAQLELITKVTSTKGALNRTLKRYIDVHKNDRVAIVVDWVLYNQFDDKFKNGNENIIIYSPDVVDWTIDVWQCSSVSMFRSIYMQMYDRFLVVGGFNFAKYFCDGGFAFSEAILVTGSKTNNSKGCPVLVMDEYFKDIGFADDENVHCFVK